MQHSDSTPSASVLVTVYNREAFLAACLDSILASTWQDFEVVVVDDCSTDASAAIAEAYADRDPRIRLFRNDRNLGDYPNRTRTAELASGRYLKYVDSDDLIYPHSLAIMMEAMSAHPDAALGVSHSLPEDEQPYPWKLEPAQAWARQFLGRGCLGCGPSGAIIRREAFFEIGGFGNWGILNDTDLWYRMAARWPVVLLPPGLVWWRRHDGQEFGRSDASDRYLEDGYRLSEEALGWVHCPLPEQERAEGVRRLRQHHARRLWSLALRQGRPLSAYRLFQASSLRAPDLIRGLGGYR